ncbi:MAG TPA: PIN domain-containing protein [Rhizomicrobium sp.]|nr:PIN domain-containing protein [Rhizomicrobium sp.]
MNAERFTLDTNILVYAVDARDRRKHALAVDILKAAVRLDCPLALQAIGEFYVAAVGKVKLAPDDARERALQLMTGFEAFAHSASAVRAGLEESARGRFSFWDAVLLASAAEAGCSVILSEDMHDGARLGSIAICNPFGAKGLSPAARELFG